MIPYFVSNPMSKIGFVPERGYSDAFSGQPDDGRFASTIIRLTVALQ